MAPLDDALLTAARDAALRRAEAEAALLSAKANEQLAVRRLQLGGGSVREIARALGYSHQRIQQMIEAIDDGRGWKRKGKAPSLLVCSFCGLDQTEVAKLIAGPSCYICDGCVAQARTDFGPRSKCSFCGKTEGVESIVGSDTFAICSECLDLCEEIIADEGEAGVVVP